MVDPYRTAATELSPWTNILVGSIVVVAGCFGIILAAAFVS